MNLLTRRQRQRPTAREDDLMLLEEAAARQQADIDRLAAERNDCTAEFVVYDVIQAGAPHGASQDLAIIAQPPKDFPPRSNVGFFSSTNCA